MTQEPEDEARLAALLSDAVSDVEPGDRLDSIRNRTKVTPMATRRSSARPWTYALGGAVATAAVIAAIAYAGGNLGLTGSSDDAPAPAAQPTTRHHHSPSPATSPSGDGGSTAPASTTAASPVGELTVAAYYLGDTPQGTRLYREFDRVTAADPLAGAVAALQQSPADPDYSTPWSPGSFTDASYDGSGTISVALADGLLGDRPSGMSEQAATMALQQVVYTLQAAAQARAGVQFTLDGQPVDRVLGVATSTPLTNADPLSTLSLMSITAPEEGASVSGTLTASGVGSSFEANVPWQVKQGDTVVKSGFTTAEGWMDKLYPWKTEAIDVSDLAPGDYTFVAMTDDPSGGEGKGPFVDTRTFTVR